MKRDMIDLINGLDAVWEYSVDNKSKLPVMFGQLIGLLQGYCDSGRDTIEISKIYKVLQKVIFRGID